MTVTIFDIIMCILTGGLWVFVIRKKAKIVDSTLNEVHDRIHNLSLELVDNGIDAVENAYKEGKITKKEYDARMIYWRAKKEELKKDKAKKH